MAFRPNYRQQRSQRDRSAKSRQEEKLEKLRERSEKRKAQREAAGLPPAGSEPSEGEQGKARRNRRYALCCVNQSAIWLPVQNTTSFFAAIISMMARKYFSRCGAPRM